MGFERFNRGFRFNPINTEGYEYRKLEELYKEYGADMEYPVRALYVNESKYGECAVAATVGFFINLPSHTVNDVREIIEDDELVQMINEERVSISIYEYYSSKYNGTFYGIKWIEKHLETPY